MDKTDPALRANDISTRQRILDAALELFAQKGYAGTSMRALARSIGLRESSIYNHFAGKDEIYRTLVDQWGPSAFYERLQSAEYRALAGDPEAFLRKCAADLLERWLDNRDQLLMTLVLRETQAFPEEGWRQYNRTLFRDEVDLMGEYLQRFSGAGQVRASDYRETARTLIAGFVFLRREHFPPDQPHSPRDQVAAALTRYVDNFLHLIGVG